MRIGIDFDNTIVSYQNVFYNLAVKKGWIPKEISPSKKDVRDYLKKEGREEDWTLLQGEVYGSAMELAKTYSGFHEFIEAAKSRGDHLFIISHRTRFPYRGPKFDLHASAKKWLQENSISIEAYFEETVIEKIKRIEDLQCDYFIDDLIELLSREDFPKNVKKILFDPHQLHLDEEKLATYHSWEELKRALHETERIESSLS